MDFDGNMRELAPKEMAVEYRGCAALKNHIALGAVFKGTAGFAQESIEQRMSAFSRETLGVAARRAERRLHVQKSGNDSGGQID